MHDNENNLGIDSSRRMRPHHGLSILGQGIAELFPDTTMGKHDAFQQAQRLASKIRNHVGIIILDQTQAYQVYNPETKETIQRVHGIDDGEHS